MPKIRALQWKRLVHMMEHAKAHVPYYRELPQPSATTDPEIALAETLARITPVDKRDLRARTSDFYAQNIPRHKVITLKTSGTTGTPLSIRCTRQALAEEFAIVWRRRMRAGVSPADQLACLWGAGCRALRANSASLLEN